MTPVITTSSDHDWSRPFFLSHPLVGDISCHQYAGADRGEQPHCDNYNGRSDGRHRSYFLFPPHLGRIGPLTAFAEHVRGNNSSKQFCSHEESQEVVQESDHRNVTRNQLNGTKHITCAASCDHFCVPGRAWMFEHKIINLRLPLESLCLIPAVHSKRGFAAHDNCPAPPK